MKVFEIYIEGVEIADLKRAAQQQGFDIPLNGIRGLTYEEKMWLGYDSGERYREKIVWSYDPMHYYVKTGEIGIRAISPVRVTAWSYHLPVRPITTYYTVATYEGMGTRLSENSVVVLG